MREYKLFFNNEQEYLNWVALREKNKQQRLEKHGANFDTTNAGFKIPEPIIYINGIKR